ncbi:MAG: hypothetical protein AB2A00_05595 [Myxococcota bacterium]
MKTSTTRRLATHFLFTALTLSGCDCRGPGSVLPGASDDAGAAGAGGDAGGNSTTHDGGSTGGDGESRGDGGIPVGDGCPAYHRRCNGTCVPITTDPNNCGDCGVVCDANEVCAGGACSGTCLANQTACHQECVDTDVDNRHCGDCDQPCDPGEGCSGGTCVEVIPVGPGPAVCPGAQVVALPDAGVQCTGDLAQVTFRWGLCSCDDVSVSQRIEIDAYNSLQGPYVPGGAGGGLGVNGRLQTSANVDVSGSLWVADEDGIGVSSPVEVGVDLYCGGRFQSSNSVTVVRDAYVHDDISAQSFTVGGTLHVPPGVDVGNATYGALQNAQFTVPPPCDCAPEELIPIASIVAARRPPDNDNAVIGLDPDAFLGQNAPSRLDLPCGAYYLRGIATSNAVTIVAHGKVALFIDGNIQSSAPLDITVAPPAELDVFVLGTLGTSQRVKLGSPAFPALTRVYVQSDNGIGLSSGLDLGAFLYAAHGPVGMSGDLEIFGGVMAGRYSTSGRTTVHYDRAVLRTGEGCGDPPTVEVDGGVPVAVDAGTITPGADAGTGPGPCQSCRDCGNQACNAGVCGACSQDSDCCAPLICLDGVCDIIPG